LISDKEGFSFPFNHIQLGTFGKYDIWIFFKSFGEILLQGIHMNFIF
jgi:hypothetical protein